MPVKLHSALLGLAMATALGGSIAPALLAADLGGATAQGPAPAKGLAPAQGPASPPSGAALTKAANRILEALRSGDGGAPRFDDDGVIDVPEVEDYGQADDNDSPI